MAGDNELTFKAILEIQQAIKDAGELQSRMTGLVAELNSKLASVGVPTGKNPFAELGAQGAKEAQRLINEFTKLEERWKNAVAALGAASAKGIKTDVLEANVRRLSQKIIDNFNAIPPHIRALYPHIQRLEQQVAGAQAQLNALGSGPAKAGLTGLTSTFQTLTGAVRLFYASIIVQKLRDFTSEIVNAAAKVEIMKNQLAGLKGSTEAGVEDFRFLAEMANRLRVDFETTIDSFVKFDVAMEKLGFTSQQARDMFEGVSVGAAGMRLSVEDTQGVFLALEQIASKGVFQMEELRKQLGNRLPAVFPLFAKELGMTTEKLSNMMKKGKLLAEEGLPALSAAVVKAFGPLAVANVDSFQSKMALLRNEFFFAKAAIGDALMPQLKELLDELILVGDGGDDSFKKLGARIGSIIQLVTDLALAMKDLASGDLGALVLRLTSSFERLGQILANIPIIMGEMVVKMVELGASLLDMIPGMEKVAEQWRKTYNTDLIEQWRAKMNAGFDSSIAATRQWAHETEVETRGAAASHEAAAERVTRSADELYGRLKAGVRDWGDTTKTEAEKAADALQKAIGREREALRGGIEALDAKKAALLASIEAETKSGDVTVQETERIKKALTDLAGKYIEANGTIDPVLQGWLDKYKLHVEGIDSVQKKLLEADKNLKERLLKDAGVSATNAKATARPSGEQDELSDAARKAEELRKTIAEIKGKQEIGPISDEELKRLYDAEDALKDIERQIGAVVDTFSDVEARAKKFGDVESANAVLMGEVNKQAQKFVDLGEAGAIAIGGQTDEASALDAIWDEIIARQKKIDEGLQGATTATGDLAAKAVEVGLGFAGADESVLHWERTLDASGQTVWKLTNLIEEAGKTGDIVWKRGADGLETMTNDAEAVADEFATIGSNANEVGSAITQAAEAGAKSLEDLGAHFETIDDWLDKINTKLDSMKDKLQAMPSIGGE